MLLEEATAAKAALGPMLLTEKMLQGEIDAKQNIVDELKGSLSADVRDITLNEYQVSELHSKLEVQRTAIQAAMIRLESIRLKAASRVGVPSSTNFFGYEDAVKAVDSTGIHAKAFTASAEALFNCGDLEIGATVQDKNGNKCKVLSRIDGDPFAEIGDRYMVALWQAHIQQNKPFRPDYDSQNAQVKHRSELYLSKAKQFQRVSEDQDGVQSTDIEYLLCMYRDAKRSNALLKRLGQVVTEAVNVKLQREAVQALNAGLKGSARVMEKVFEKYNGDFALVCDLARMTFICDKFDAAQAVLETVCSASDLDGSIDLEPFLIKNRLMDAFDATETGGYRDALINARDRSNGHIVEIQITLRGLFAIKSGGGHSEYKLTRVLDLNDTSVSHYDGELTLDVIEKVKKGLIHHLKWTTGLTEYFDELVSALAAPTCLIRTIKIGHGTATGSSGFPEGKRLADFFTTEVVAQLKPRLEEIGFASCKGIRGEIPIHIYEQCTRLRSINVSQSVDTIGSIPPAVKNLVNLKGFLTWGSGMSGPLPREVFSMGINGCFHAPHTHSCRCYDGEYWKVGGEHFSIDDAERAYDAHLQMLSK